METTSNFQNINIGFIVFLAFGIGCSIAVTWSLFPETRDKMVKSLIMLGWYIFGPILGSIIYFLLSSKSFREFVLYGVVTIIVCISLSLLFHLTFSLKNKQYISEYQGSKLILLTIVFSQGIPFAIFYILSSLTISGFKIPFNITSH